MNNIVPADNMSFPSGASSPYTMPSPPTTPPPLPPLNTVTATVTIPATTMPVQEPARSNNQPPPMIETLTWDKIDVDLDGNVVGAFGIRFVQLSSKQLRTVCSRLNIRGIKNAKKQVMIDSISQHYKNRKAYDALDVCPAASSATNSSDSFIANATNTPRKEIQCPFRLMNILFSDQFAQRFAATGNAATRDILDTGMAGNDQHFWQCVRTAFISPIPNPTFDELMFQDDIVMSLQSDDIDPSKIIPHQWKKLRTIWKASNSEYRAALTRFTVSGTHESAFWNFCNGRLEAYYLHKLLSLRPNLAGFVGAELPPEAALASNMTGAEIISRLNASSPSDVSSHATNNKRKRSPAEGTMDNITSNSDARAELAREKIRILRLEELRQLEHSTMKQWEGVVQNLRELRQDFCTPNLTEEEKDDIRRDMEALKMKKNNLALKLGFRDAI